MTAQSSADQPHLQALFDVAMDTSGAYRKHIQRQK
jgi:hypothetical protein